MNLYALSLGTSLLCLSTSVFADVKLSMPENSELILVNGKEIAAKQTIDLHNGDSQIAFRYHSWYQHRGEQTQFKSDVIIIKFTATNQDIELKLPKITSDNAADAFNQSPQISLIDSKDHKVTFEQGKLIKEGMQLGRDYEVEMKAYNLSIKSASLLPTVTSVTNPVVISTPKNIEKSTSTDQINIGQMLDFWYQQADEETRKAFKQKIN